MNIDDNQGSNDLDLNQEITSDPGSSSGQSHENTGNQTPNLNDYVSKARVQELLHQRTREVSQKTAEKTRAEVMASLDKDRQSPSVSGIGGMPNMDETKIRHLMQEEFDKREKERRENYEQESYHKKANDLAQDFMSKISSSKEHPELIKRQDEIAELAVLVPYLNELSDVAGVSQHILDNENAYANLLALSSQSPNRVRTSLKKIEAALKQNSAAKNREYPDAPLSHPSPSFVTADSGSSSIESIKSDPFYRG